KQTRIKPSKKLGDYEIVTNPAGTSSIKQISSGEVMHSVSGPSEESQKLYVDQSCLAVRLLKRSDDDNAEVVIWDVGLGAASNAMAALQCFERELAERGPAVLRPLRIVSFECDLHPLALATKDAGAFPHLRHRAPYEILKNSRWSHASGLLSWELHVGDFLQFLESSAVPDLIYFDPFSSKTDTGLWTPEVFARIFKHCAPKSAELYTYAAGTGVRAAMLNAGFSVAEGIGTGPKATTTLAFTRLESAQHHPLKPTLLGEPWLARWRRSDSQYPKALSGDARESFAASIEHHPQFFRSEM
ncbi:MAG TPA: MnmC family methyltransferase, partial [Rariglobus sp.]|nr:MnmC family methyltransferase [Rariglobus sp.]